MEDGEVTFRLVSLFSINNARMACSRTASDFAPLVPEQALHEALWCRDLSEVSLRIGVTKVYETFAPLPGGHFE